MPVKEGQQMASIDEQVHSMPKGDIGDFLITQARKGGDTDAIKAVLSREDVTADDVEAILKNVTTLAHLSRFGVEDLLTGLYEKSKDLTRFVGAADALRWVLVSKPIFGHMPDLDELAGANLSLVVADAKPAQIVELVVKLLRSADDCTDDTTEWTYPAGWARDLFGHLEFDDGTKQTSMRVVIMNSLIDLLEGGGHERLSVRDVLVAVECLQQMLAD